MHNYFGDLLKSVRQSPNGGGGYTLEMADKVYVQQGLPLLDTFKSTLAQHYGGSQSEESVDFTQSAATAQVPPFCWFLQFIAFDEFKK